MLSSHPFCVMNAGPPVAPAHISTHSYRPFKSTPCTCADALVAIKVARIAIVASLLRILSSIGARAASRVPRRSLQAVHSPGCGERSCATDTIALCIESLGARQGHVECCLRARLGAGHRAGGWLAVKLGVDCLARGRPGIRIICELPHGLLELRDRVAARAGTHRCGAEE